MENLYSVVTLSERPDLKDNFSELHSVGWKKFMREDPIGTKYWNKLLSWFPEFQFLLLNNEGKSIACGNSIPFYWDGNNKSLPSGWDEVLEKGILDFQDNKTPNTVSALAIVIHPDNRGLGLSKRMVLEMKNLIRKNKFHQMVAPVRPSMKSIYPLIPIEEYISWTTLDGKPFDPWIRTHCDTGAEILSVASESMVIPASIDSWEQWTGMTIPASGSYIISDGLVPLIVDKETNTGVYIEPNVWLKHYLD
jgi:hypothetical protein